MKKAFYQHLRSKALEPEPKAVPLPIGFQIKVNLSILIQAQLTLFQVLTSSL